MKRLAGLFILILALGVVGCSISSDDVTKSSASKALIANVEIAPNNVVVEGNTANAKGEFRVDSAYVTGQTLPILVSTVPNTGEVNADATRLFSGTLSAWLTDPRKPLRLNLASTMLVGLVSGSPTLEEIAAAQDDVAAVINILAGALGVPPMSAQDLFYAPPAKVEVIQLAALAVAANDAGEDVVGNLKGIEDTLNVASIFASFGADPADAIERAAYIADQLGQNPTQLTALKNAVVTAAEANLVALGASKNAAKAVTGTPILDTAAGLVLFAGQSDTALDIIDETNSDGVDKDWVVYVYAFNTSFNASGLTPVAASALAGYNGQGEWETLVSGLISVPTNRQSAIWASVNATGKKAIDKTFKFITGRNANETAAYSFTVPKDTNSSIRFEAQQPGKPVLKKLLTIFDSNP